MRKSLGLGLLLTIGALLAWYFREHWLEYRWYFATIAAVCFVQQYWVNPILKRIDNVADMVEHYERRRSPLYGIDDADAKRALNEWMKR